MDNENILKNTSLFNNISQEQLSELTSLVEEIKVLADTTFIREGDKADALYVIKDGVLQVFTLGKDNLEVVLAKLEKGSFFGEQALLTATPGFRNASVRTLTDSILLKINHDIFLHLIEADDALKKELEKIGIRHLLEKLKAKGFDYDISRYLVDEENIYETKSFEKGKSIIVQGELTKGVYFLLSGTVSVYKKTEGGIDQLISTIVPNNIFGEASLISDQPRQATVKANEQVTVFYISPDKFWNLYQKKPELKVIVDALQKVYQSPVRGEVTQYFGHFLHMPAVISRFKLKDGREIVSNMVIERNIQSISVSGIQNPQTISFENKAIYRELQLDDGILIGVTAYGEWDALKELYSRVFDKIEMGETELTHFEKSGELAFIEIKEEEDRDQVICTCMCITRGEIIACIKNGCTSQYEISEKTCAGTVCGGCVPTIQAMLGHEGWRAMHIFKSYRLTPDVRAYRLIPVQRRSLQRFYAGQHIVIQCEVEGNWIERSYTVTSAPQNSEYFEIAVKREEKGLLSRWLFDNDQSVPFIRVSNPSGYFTFDPTKPCSMICFSAGIGITPAVCFARTISQIDASRTLFIYASARNIERLAYDSELEELSKLHPKIKYLKHLTEMKGRMKPEEIIEIAHLNPTADFFICGPKDFESMVKSALETAGIKSGQIIIEQFTHAFGSGR